LKLAGVWVEHDDKPWHKVLAFCMRCYMMEIFFLHQAIYIIKLKDYGELTEIAKVFCTSVCYTFKSYNLIRKRKEVDALMVFAKELMEEGSWLEKSRGIKLQKQLASAKRMFTIYGSMGLFAMSSIFAIPLQTHQLFAKFYFPYDYQQNEIVFWLTVFYQNIGCTLLIPAAITLDMIPVVFMAIATGFIEELNDCLEDLSVEDDQKLIKCIEIHLRIKDFVNRIQGIFSPMLMIQGLVSTLILCSTYFMVTKVKHLTFLLSTDMSTLINYLISVRQLESNDGSDWLFILDDH